MDRTDEDRAEHVVGAARRTSTGHVYKLGETLEHAVRRYWAETDVKARPAECGVWVRWTFETKRFGATGGRSCRRCTRAIAWPPA